MSAEIKTGDRVRSHVSVLGERVATHLGIVVRNYGDGTCDVDRMSLHGGAPWVFREATSSLTKESTCECARCGDPIQGAADTFAFCSDCNAEIDDE